jgi:ABC-type branched-subunit amino acid transport system substrate-binding protein
MLNGQEIKVCYCCAPDDPDDPDDREDQILLGRLVRGLEPLLKSDGPVTFWHEGSVLAGTNEEEAISAQLRQADVILLLISPSFINTEYYNGRWMEIIRARHIAGQAIVIPVLLRPVDWENDLKLKRLPRNKKAITIWKHLDLAFKDVISGIRQVVNELRKQQQQTVPLLPELEPDQPLKESLVTPSRKTTLLLQEPDAHQPLMGSSEELAVISSRKTVLLPPELDEPPQWNGLQDPVVISQPLLSESVAPQQQVYSPLPHTPSPIPIITHPVRPDRRERIRQAMTQVKRWHIVLIVAIICFPAIIAVILPALPHPRPAITKTFPCNFVPTPAAINQGIGAVPRGSDCIGISDGSVTAFDMDPTGQPAGYVRLKQEVVQYLAKGDYSDAYDLYTSTYIAWDKSSLRATYDPETLIYLEDLEITQYIHKYGGKLITLVVPTVFSIDAGGARDILRGAYVSQNEVNAPCLMHKECQLGVRLLIANAGSNPEDAVTVSRQIIQAAQADPSIVGVIGWSLSTYEQPAIDILAAAHIPMISSAASYDYFKSPFFFRVVPTNSQQVEVAALYAQQHGYQRIVVLYDPQDTYSDNLGKDFIGNSYVLSHLVDPVTFSVNDPSTIMRAWQEVERKHANPDLLYFAGYAHAPDDLGALLALKQIPASLKILGGDALSVLGDYSQIDANNYDRLSFTAFASPAEWQSVGLNNPLFFQEYLSNFDPATLDPQQRKAGSYGWGRPSAHEMLAYDALNVTLYAYTTAIRNGNETLQQALTDINGSQSCEGVTGRIGFQQGNVVNKAIVMLTVDKFGHTQLDPDSLPFYQQQLSASYSLCDSFNS